jgi:hypothetical protein
MHFQNTSPVTELQWMGNSIVLEETTRQLRGRRKPELANTRNTGDILPGTSGLKNRKLIFRFFFLFFLSF